MAVSRVDEDSFAGMDGDGLAIEEESRLPFFCIGNLNLFMPVHRESFDSFLVQEDEMKPLLRSVKQKWCIHASILFPGFGPGKNNSRLNLTENQTMGKIFFDFLSRQN